MDARTPARRTNGRVTADWQPAWQIGKRGRSTTAINRPSLKFWMKSARMLSDSDYESLVLGRLVAARRIAVDTDQDIWAYDGSDSAGIQLLRVERRSGRRIYLCGVRAAQELLSSSVVVVLHALELGFTGPRSMLVARIPADQIGIRA